MCVLDYILPSLLLNKQKKNATSLAVTNELGNYSNNAKGRGLLISRFLIQVRFSCGRLCNESPPMGTCVLACVLEK